jgi:hypothetical protein
VTELGYDTNLTTVIPNREEKFITFSKYVSNKFTIRFIDSCGFMPSKLSTLAENLIRSGFEKFGETAKAFLLRDMDLVTRKVVYFYEYKESWEKLEEMTLPTKENFYSTLAEEHIDDKEYGHVITI